MATDLCLRILKFSHATQRSDGSIPWTHIAGENMYLIVNGSSSVMPSGDLEFRLIHNNEVIEQIDIAGLIDGANAATRNLEHAGTNLHVDAVPVVGMTRDKLLALRYRLDDGRTRRVQFKIEAVSDCCRVTDALRQRGMIFQTKQSETSRPSSALTENPRIGRSSQTYAPLMNATIHPVSMNDGAISAFPGSSQATQRRSQSVALGGDTDLASAMSNSHVPITGTTVTQYKVPTTSSSRDSLPRLIQRRSELGELWSSETLGRSSSPFFAATSGQYISSARPTTSLTGPLPGTLEHEIPPRRELPFNRARGRHVDEDGPSSRPDSSASNLPPLPKPTWALEPAAAPPSVEKGSARYLMSSSEKRSHAAIDGEGDPLQTSLGSIVHPSIISGLPSAGGPCATDQVPSASEKRPRRMDDLLYGRTALSERSINDRSHRRPVPNSLLHDGPHVAIEQAHDGEGVGGGPKGAIRSSCQDDLASWDEQASRVPNDSSARDRLCEYAAQKRGDRLAALDEFMVQHLDNEDFAMLCEDVENCWRRIALGL